jgi:hypothetical protein
MLGGGVFDYPEFEAISSSLPMMPRGALLLLTTEARTVNPCSFA